MNFKGNFSALDIEQYSNSGKRSSKMRRPYAKNEGCLIIVVMGSISIVLIVVIGMIITRFVQCRRISEENKTQLDFNGHQKDIVDDIQFHYDKLQEEKEQMRSSMIILEHDRDKALELYKVMSNPTMTENDLKYNSIQAAIIEMNEKGDYYKKNIQANQERLKPLEVQAENHSLNKQRLNDRIMLLKQKLYPDTYPNPKPQPQIGKYGSSIITTDRQYNVLKKWISQGRGFMMSLQYIGTEHQNSIDDFYRTCSDKTILNSLIVMKVTDGTILGGFSYNNWEGHGFKQDDSAFVFNLSKEKMYCIARPKEAIYVHKNSWPTFGHGDLVIDSFDKCYSDFPISYGNDDEKLALTGGVNSFQITTLEVFTLFKSND